ncbi:hypothetical protein Csa_007421 [Cucumis sativus]|uniref:Uncharacterized protein n=1 Tax=Cucumis sativus TaxID=3659 RepID=A0A0A0M3L9_CUCSA|nr:hypothetical protein Csa_007421 [Cucumis sativus]
MPGERTVEEQRMTNSCRWRKTNHGGRQKTHERKTFSQQRTIREWRMANSCRWRKTNDEEDE